jgi:hypothetical protein
MCYLKQRQIQAAERTLQRLLIRRFEAQVFRLHLILVSISSLMSSDTDSMRRITVLLETGIF